MTGQDEIAAALEELVQHHGLVPVVHSLSRICADRAERLGAVMRDQRTDVIGSLVRGLGRYVIRRQRGENE